LLGILLIGVVLLYRLDSNEQQKTEAQGDQQTERQNQQTEEPTRPKLVIPESRFGTLGLISAIAAGFGAFKIAKKEA